MHSKFIMLFSLIVATGCIKYKKSYKLASSGEAATEEGTEGAPAEDAGGGEEELGDEGGEGEITEEGGKATGEGEETALTGNLLTALKDAKSTTLTADLSLNGKHTLASRVSFTKTGLKIVASGLSAIKKEPFELQVFNGNELSFTLPVSGVTLADGKNLKLTLTRCVFKTTPPSAKVNKEVQCKWTARQIAR